MNRTWKRSMNLSFHKMETFLLLSYTSARKRLTKLHPREGLPKSSLDRLAKSHQSGEVENTLSCGARFWRAISTSRQFTSASHWDRSSEDENWFTKLIVQFESLRVIEEQRIEKRGEETLSNISSTTEIRPLNQQNQSRTEEKKEGTPKIIRQNLLLANHFKNKHPQGILFDGSWILRGCLDSQPDAGKMVQWRRV